MNVGEIILRDGKQFRIVESVNVKWVRVIDVSSGELLLMKSAQAEEEERQRLENAEAIRQEKRRDAQRKDKENRERREAKRKLGKASCKQKATPKTPLSRESNKANYRKEKTTSSISSDDSVWREFSHLFDNHAEFSNKDEVSRLQVLLNSAEERAAKANCDEEIRKWTLIRRELEMKLHREIVRLKIE